MSQKPTRQQKNQAEIPNPSGAIAKDPSRLRLKQQSGESQADTLARHALQPEVQAAITIKHYERGTLSGASLDELLNRLAEQSALSNKGDMSRSESLLTAQAHTLDAIFHDLARRAVVNAGEYPEAFEMYLRLSLKAQSQCRTTIEALAEIKNPSHVSFVKQANITSGPQQVNNAALARGEILNQQNELLEQTDGKWLDFGAKGAAISADKAIETVGAVDRAKNRRR
jgi:hypothetical protein